MQNDPKLEIETVTITARWFSHGRPCPERGAMAGHVPPMAGDRSRSCTTSNISAWGPGQQLPHMYF